MGLSRERLILLPLTLGVVASVALLATFFYRSSFQLEQLREQSVVEATHLLANEKADRLEKAVIAQDNAVLALVGRDPLEQFAQRWLEVASVQTPTVRSVLLIDLDSQSREVLGYASRAPGLADDEFRRTLLFHLWSELNWEGPGVHELRHLHTTWNEQSYLLSYKRLSINEGERLLVIWHDVPRIVHDVFPRIYNENLSTAAVSVDDEQTRSLTRRGEEASRMNVVDAQGRIIYGPPLSRGGLTLGRQFPTTLYRWRVNISMIAAEELAEELEQRRVLEVIMVAIAALVVIAGLIVIVVAVIRERKLAMLKSEFVANVSHELKTPLSLVRMFSEMLLSGRAPEAKRDKYLEIIVGESERLSALIDNVLDFSRMERGRESFEFRRISPDEAFARAVDVCLPRAERLGVRLEYTSTLEEKLKARIDERALEIGLINLIDNALKYAEGTESIEVHVCLKNNFIEVRVTDHGPGVPDVDRKRVFERFVRGKHKAGDSGRGSGIGLAMVAQIARAHGGRAWVEKVEPQGACFIMTLVVNED
ncbi:MAG: HAMP domain-containing histidine kinase [Polyangiaceae bacterium]|nr:HAMP domain-containing histidine kinase [Polyangiaceae bacterium]